MYMKIKKQFILGVLFLGSVLVAVCYAVRYPQFFLAPQKLQATSIRFLRQGISAPVELAVTPYQWSKGLMFRESLPEDAGMLFVFPDEKERSFWMKNTYIPLDILFISADKRIVSITKNAVPCATLICPSYVSGERAMYVLEVNAGFADAHAIREGDSVEL